MPDRSEPSPEAMLRSFIARFEPADQKLIRAVRAALRKRLPTAHELLYDYTTFFVIGYSPTERGIDSVLAFAGRPDGLRLYFSQGPLLRDPKGLLEGKGKATRFIRLTSAKQLADPDVVAFTTASIAQAKIPLAATGKGKFFLRPKAAKKKPARRPGK